jgi:hypothetical protein
MVPAAYPHGVSMFYIHPIIEDLRNERRVVHEELLIFK